MITEWPNTLELTLDGIAQGGEGVGRWEGRVVFARGGLPGEHVHVRIDQRREAYAHGTVTEIINASPERVEPLLADADHIAWQYIAYPAQLRFKQQILSDQLAKIGGLEDVTVAETLSASQPWNYRNSARLHIVDGTLGYFANESRTLQPLDNDPLLLPALNQALQALQAVLAPEDDLDEVLLRASETYGYVAAALRGAGDGRDLAVRWRAACPALVGVTLPDGASVGADYVIEELGGVAFQLRPTTFFQVNIGSASTLLQLVREGLALRGDERLLDLYCGAGAFTLPLATEAREITGIEEFAASVEDAQVSAVLNEITNAQFIVGPVERALEQLEGPFDGVVLDPPRRGCHPQALAALLRLAPPRIVYISCQPATLSRDLKILVAGGYRVVSAQPVDQFPQTAHIESVCVLVKDAPLADESAA